MSSTVVTDLSGRPGSDSTECLVDTSALGQRTSHSVHPMLKYKISISNKGHSIHLIFTLRIRT